MSPLAVRPGRNAAREAKRLKEVRRVKGAIEWNVKEREKRQKLFRERWESKQSLAQRKKWELDNITKVRTTALKNAREDWLLGPLRPNRAIGAAGEKYGALTGEQVQKPEIPVHTWKHRNEVRVKRGLEPEYPLVVDDKKYFHIAKDDRVVVIRGREKGKIGVVQSTLARTHQVFITDINTQYYDASVFNNAAIDTPTRKSEVPIDIDDVRLVVPFEIVRTDIISPGGEPVETKTYKDVVVDKVFMEQHTTGVDPFTGRDYGASEFPKEHRYDPVTGLPIFHRYIAGTKERIFWPDEKKEVKEKNALETQQKEVKRSLWDKIRGKNKQVATSKPTSNSRREAKGLSIAEKTEKRELKTEMHELRKSLKPVRPKSQKVDEYDVYEADTTRNVIDATESMTYNIVQPPFPETLGEELRTHMKDFAAAQRKDQDAAAPTKKRVKFMTEAAIAASEQGEARRVAALKMKTPMQLRWESEQAQKIKQREESPLVSTDELMAALGKHIEQQKTLKTLKKTVQKQSLRTEELD